MIVRERRDFFFIIADSSSKYNNSRIFNSCVINLALGKRKKVTNGYLFKHTRYILRDPPLQN